MSATLSCSTALLALLCQQDGPGGAKAPTDPVIATVGGVEIRLGDLIDEVNRQIPLAYYHRKVPPEKMGEIRRTAFDKLVVKHLIHLDARDAGLVASEAEIRQEFEDALTKAGPRYTGMPAAQRAQLLAQLRPAVTRRVLIRKNEELQLAKIPKIGEEKVREIYHERIAADPQAFMSLKEVHLQHIFVKVDPARIKLDDAEKKAKIESAQAEIQKGKPFADVARIYSEDEFAAKGGDLGFQKEGSFRMKTLNEYAFKLDKGAVSDVIRSLHGYHLLRCVDIKPSRRLGFDEMRPAIEKFVADEHAQMARGRWLARLRDKFKIEVLRQDVLQDDPKAASPPGPDPTSRPKAKK